MALSPAIELLVLVVGTVAIVTAVLGWRHPLAFRIALRNVRRGRTRTVLLIAGLLIGTTIISGSLIVGDTVHQLSYHYSYLGAGYVDEAIYGTSASGGFVYFPTTTYGQIATAIASNTQIVGVTPEIVDTCSAYDHRTGVPETNLNLIGVNGNQSAALGAFVTDAGATITGPVAGMALIDDQTASALNATAGDSLTLFGRNATVLTVQAVVQENVRGAFITAGLSPGNVFVPLATAQQLENASGRINYIAVTNTGSQPAGAASSASVSGYLNSTVASELSVQHLTVHTPLADALHAADAGATGTETIFLVLGLFSIVAGAMLIVGIFVMLAEERKGEMGMLRAVGLRRRELVYSYFFEGVTYSAGSALAGTLLGVAVGYFLCYLAGFALASQGIPAGALLQSFTATQQSLVIAYVAGFLLTLVTVVVACRRASRLNIVRAIRDIPEPPPQVRTYTFLAYLGAAATVLGLLLFLTSYRGATDLSLPLAGGALAIVGLGLVASRFTLNRPIFTAVGIALLVWAGLEPLHRFLLGSSHTGGIFIVFVEGIQMVAGAVLVFVFNGPALAHAASRTLGARSESSPVVRVGLAYPSRQPTRTAISLTIFALVVFTMVGTAGFGAAIGANLNHTVALESGGYSFFGFSQVPMPNLWNRIAANATLERLFTNAVPLVTGAVDVNVSAYSGNPFVDSLYAAPANASGPASFYATNQFTFGQTWRGMSSTQVFRALQTNASVAVLDGGYAPPTTNFGGGPSRPHPIVTPGSSIEITAPGSSVHRNVTVIGLLQETILGGVWVNPTTAAALGYTNATAYFLTAGAGVSTTYAAQQAKIAFFSSGLVLFDIEALLASGIATTQGFVGLLEIFVGLGLGVGVAAMGILALRAVVERRKEIGMLRAAGFTQAKVLRVFVLEYTFVTVLGVAIGVALGLLLIFDLTQSSSAAAAGITSFVVPWATVAEIAVVAYALVLVAIAGPALRASRLPPAEAVRASE